MSEESRGKTYASTVVNERESVPEQVPEWVSRAQASELAGVSKSTLRRLEREGALRTRENEQGWHLYRVEELVQIRRTRVVAGPSGSSGSSEGSQLNALSVLSALSSSERGERAATVFARLDEGQSGADIVIALRMEPEEVMMWQAQWSKLRGRGMWVSEATLSRMLRASLALGPGPVDLAAPALDTLRNEEALLSAVARAADVAKNVFTAYDTPERLADWLRARWQPGQAGKLTVMGCALGFSSVAGVDRFELSAWEDAHSLSRALFAALHQMLRMSEMRPDTDLVSDGNFELALCIDESGAHRTWVTLPTSLGQQARAQSFLKTENLRGRTRLRERKEQEQDEDKDRQNQRRHTLAEKERARKEQAREEAQERARERTRERDEYRELMGGSGDSKPTKPAKPKTR